MKVVVNKCFGGFSLSDEGTARYLELAGKRFWREADKFGATFWLVPPEERLKKLSTKEWMALSVEDRVARNQTEANHILYNRDIPRDDPILVRVVEEMGFGANGSCAALHVVEIPDGVDWEVSEYDGMEHIAEKHRTW